MSPTANLPAAILDVVLGRLTPLFLTPAAPDDLPAARDAASQMLAAYCPETPDELRLAVEIISFSFHALEALSQATDPNMSLNQKLRLRGSAVSLSRESHKSQRKLDQLQKARRSGALAQPAETAAARSEPVQPKMDQALAAIKTIPQPVVTVGKTSGQTWTQAYQQRQTAKRIAENLRKNQANASPQVASAAIQGAAPMNEPGHPG